MNELQAVFHIDELPKWELTLGNVQNLITDIGIKKHHIEIVANAAAVTLFTAPTNEAAAELLQKMNALIKQEVKISFCKNALRANDIQEETLPVFITIVPAGITRLILLQEKGYCYIKP